MCAPVVVLFQVVSKKACSPSRSTAGLLPGDSYVVAFWL